VVDPDPDHDHRGGVVTVLTHVDCTVAANVRHHRVARGLSQASVARAMAERGFGFSPATVWKIEAGQRPVKLAEVVALADALGLPARTLTDDDPDTTGLDPQLCTRATDATAIPVPVAQPRCLDCAAVLHIDDATGELVDSCGQAGCQASYRTHVPDLPQLPVRSAGPAAPATSMPDRLRRTVTSWRTALPGGLNTAGAGAVPDPPLPHKGRSAPGGLRVAARPPAAALDAGDPAGPVSGALRAGATTAPARPESGPAHQGSAP
jgi:transcriptional regulator with XRE-family HTH domain